MRISILSICHAWIWALFMPIVCLADEAAVRSTLLSYADAYNKHDAAAIGALWDENATHVDRVAGTRTQGRAAIQADLETLFQADASTHLVAEVDSIRSITADVVAVEGRSIVSSDEKDGEVSNFSIILVKKGDAWLFHTAEELPAVPATGTQLKDLEWLIGKWIDESQDEKIESEFRWSNSGAFLVRSYSRHSAEGSEPLGTQIIGWDPRGQQVRSWSFHADGSFCEATWSRNGADWMVQTSNTLADGKLASGTYVMTPIDDTSMTVQLIGHSIDGEPQPASDSVKLTKAPADASNSPETTPSK